MSQVNKIKKTRSSDYLSSKKEEESNSKRLQELINWIEWIGLVFEDTDVLIGALLEAKEKIVSNEKEFEIWKTEGQKFRKRRPKRTQLEVVQ